MQVITRKLLLSKGFTENEGEGIQKYYSYNDKIEFTHGITNRESSNWNCHVDSNIGTIATADLIYWEELINLLLAVGQTELAEELSDGE